MEEGYKQRCIRALSKYYENFGSRYSRTFASCAREQKVYVDDLIDFVIDNELGMPSHRKDALRFLKKLSSFA